MLYTVSFSTNTDCDSEMIETLDDILDDFHSAIETLEALNEEIEDAVSDISERLDIVEDKIKELVNAVCSVVHDDKKRIL